MTAPEILPQQEREYPDPYEGSRPMPWPVLVLAVLLVLLSVTIIVDDHLEIPAAWGDGRVEAELQGRAAPPSTQVDGAAIYASLCAACHQANGAGLPGVFPPLADSEWVLGKETTLVAIVLHGVSGPLTVKGQAYNGAMPAFKTQLDDAQIAGLLTHLRTRWGHVGPAVSAETVASVRRASPARTAPFAGGHELAALP